MASLNSGWCVRYPIVLVAAIAAMLTAVFGSGIASADPYAGQTYADATAQIASRRQTAVIATVNGDHLETDQCIVASSTTSLFLDASGDGPKREVLLNLNCNADIAAPGRPGNSAMSPQGRKAMKERELARSISKDPAWCEATEQRLNDCRKLCDRTGLCEV